MHKDFMLLNDNTIEVTSGDGIETNRGEIINNNVKGILLAENKVKILEIFKKSFDKEIDETNKMIYISKWMLILQPVFIEVISMFGFLYGAIFHLEMWPIYGLINSFLVFKDLIIPTTISMFYWVYTRQKNKVQKRRMETVLNKIEEIKKESEIELINERNIITSNNLEPIVRISLEEETEDMMIQITKELITYAEENMKKNGKIRIRKR